MRIKKPLSILLICAMIITMLPVMSFAGDEDGQTDEVSTKKSISLNAGDITELDYIYYGKWKGNSIKWLVLNKKTNTREDDGFFLLSDSILESRKMTAEDNGPWRGSGFQKWCEDFAGISGSSVPDAFSPAEFNEILATTKTDVGHKKGNRGTFDEVPNALNGDKVFELSSTEVDVDIYGPPYEKVSKETEFETTIWSLRSRGSSNGENYIGKCDDLGAYASLYAENDVVGIRPAFNLGKSNILFASSADGGKKDADVDGSLTAVNDWSGNEWKVTLKDSSRNFNASVDRNEVNAGDTITVDYSGAKTGDNEYVSAVITDKNDKVLYYGRIAQSSTNGSVQISVPKGIELGEHVLKVFSEQCNEDRNTDYASDFVNFNITIGRNGNKLLPGYDSENGYEYIYYGSYDGSPIKWRVLDNQTNTGEPGYFLLSEELLGSGYYGGVYFSDDGINTWQGSYAQSWCGEFAENSFTEDEKNYVMTVSKKEAREYEENDIVGFYESELINEKVFFLSAYEARNPSYGFTGNETRVAKWKYDSRAWWWIRSYFALHGMGYIDTDGSMAYGDFFDEDALKQRRPARPAFNLDGSDILFLSNAKGGKADTETDPDLAAIPEQGSGEWKLTIHDRTRTNFSARTLGYTDVAAGTDIRVGYSGARNGSNEYVSVIIADEQGQNLYYGRIAEDSESGEAAVAVPYSLPVGNYTLKVYSEQYNGDYRTDYAGNFVELPISVTGPDTEGPYARIESVRRISTTEAEVTFKSSEPGKYSYTLVESGKGFETTFGDDHGVIPNRKAQTIIVSGLRPRQGCDIYFAVFDQSDNQYPQKVMAQIPADVIHEVTLHAGNGAVIAEGKDITQYAEGENVLLPTAEDMSRNGGVFKGWYTDCDFSGEPVTQISDDDKGDKVFYAKWKWDSKEQYNLSPGTTYYFDLSGAGIPGTVNGGNSVGAASVPDKSLHYVPFTYVGTIDAYSFSSNTKTSDESAVGNQYIHSLFVSDYNVVHYTGWSDIDKAGLIFGKTYTSGNISYTMRALSGGNRYTNGGTEAIGPRNNEWDTILDKNEEYIKNTDMFSWVQDEYENENDKILTWRILRGYNINGGTVRTAGSSFEGNIQEHYGFRPVLEIQDANLGTEGMKPVTLDLNGGSLNGSTDNIQIVVKKGEAFTAPASEGLVSDTGLLSKWIGSDGKSYQPGDSVPAEVTSLTAQWGKLSGEIKVGTHKWNKLLTDVTFDLFFKNGQSVEITASDKNSGNVTIEYLVSDKKLTDFKQMAFLPYSGELHIGDSYLDKDGRYIIYARLSDASGNVRYISSDGIVVDNTAPVISGITDGKTYCEAQIVSVEEANPDSITVNGNPVTLTDGKCTLNPADGEQTVVVTDKVGNTASVTVTVNDGHTPLADDNDCTTPVLCSYCNAVITAAKQHDFTGALQSNETGHWHQCQNDGCTVCDTKASHTGNPEWETTETQHTKKYLCCGYVTVETASHQWEKGVCTECGYVCAHSGGEATCTEFAQCEYCHEKYGDKNPDNHSGEAKWIKTSTTHMRKWDCCDKEIIAKEAHEWKDGVCEECGYRQGSGSGAGASDSDVITVKENRNEQIITVTKTTIKNTKTELTADEYGRSIEKIIAKVSDYIAKELIRQSVSNKSDSVEITVKSNDGNKAGGEKQTELEIPVSVIESVAADTNAALVVKTGSGQITLDNKALGIMAAAADGETLRIVVTANMQLKEAQKPAADAIGSTGVIFDVAAYIGNTRIYDLKDGKAEILLPVPENLKDKDIAVIYISDKGICEIVNHTAETVGEDSFVKFTASQFADYAVVEKTDADKLIEKQNIDKIKSLVKEVKLKATTSKTSKENVRVKIGEVKNLSSLIKEADTMGYTVKYKYYRSVKKSSKYAAKITKKNSTYINTKGKKGTKYYYKAKVLVYDGKTLIAQTELKQCRYGSRIWSR